MPLRENFLARQLISVVIHKGKHVEQFSFEHTFKFNEELYVRLNSLFTKKSKPLRLSLIAVAGVLCLFWEYSILLGVIILLLSIISLFLPSSLPGTVAANYRKMDYLHSELTYGVNKNKLWVTGKELSVELGWQHAVVWDVREGWLRITAHNIPVLWFEIEKLKEAGVYEKVIELCKKHAVRFDSK